MSAEATHMKVAGEARKVAPGRILIVEDERSVRTVLQLALGRFRHQVDCVETAEVALEKVLVAPPDILIVDKNLPGMDGVELIRQVREAHGEDIWSIMITAFPSARSAIDTLHLGVCFYLEKPFDNIFHVVERIEEVLALKQKCDRVRSSTERLRTLRMQSAPIRPRVAIGSPNELDRRWMADRLLGRGEAMCASSIDELLTFVRLKPPHVIVVDLSFGEVDLFSRLAELRQAAPEARLAAVCEEPSFGLITRLIDAGVHAVLERPLSEELFLQRLEGALRKADAPGLSFREEVRERAAGR